MNQEQTNPLQFLIAALEKANKAGVFNLADARMILNCVESINSQLNPPQEKEFDIEKVLREYCSDKLFEYEETSIYMQGFARKLKEYKLTLRE